MNGWWLGVPPFCEKTNISDMTHGPRHIATLLQYCSDLRVDKNGQWHTERCWSQQNWSKCCLGLILPVDWDGIVMLIKKKWWLWAQIKQHPPAMCPPMPRAVHVPWTARNLQTFRQSEGLLYSLYMVERANGCSFESWFTQSMTIMVGGPLKVT